MGSPAAYSTAYSRRWRAANPERTLAISRRGSARRYAKGRAVIAAAKSTPCVDCWQRFPAVCMEFDHVGPQAKSFNISQWHRSKKAGGGAGKIEALEAEIAKCVVRCANCHRVRHLAD